LPNNSTSVFDSDIDIKELEPPPKPEDEDQDFIQQLCAVQPMSLPTAQVFYLDIVYGSASDRVRETP
jgi:hypothetical protein